MTLSLPESVCRILKLGWIGENLAMYQLANYNTIIELINP